jgi:hypothetical protein
LPQDPLKSSAANGSVAVPEEVSYPKPDFSQMVPYKVNFFSPRTSFSVQTKVPPNLNFGLIGILDEKNFENLPVLWDVTQDYLVFSFGGLKVKCIFP